MTDPLAWIIALAFYLPLHYLGPMLVGFLTGPAGARERRRLLKSILIDCTVSMALAFALAIWLFDSRMQTAVGILFVSMAVPYLHLFLAGKRRSLPPEGRLRSMKS
jgi:hypothetical protein